MDVPTVLRAYVPPTILVEEGPAPVRDYRTSAATKGPLRIVQGRARHEAARFVLFLLLAAALVSASLAAVLLYQVCSGTGATLFLVVTGLVALVLPYVALRRFFNQTTITIADERLELRTGPFPPGFHGWMFVSTMTSISCEEGEAGHRVVADRIDGIEVPLSEWRRDEAEARCIEQALNAYLGRVVVVDDVST